MAPALLLWLLLSDEPNMAVQETLGTAEILDPAEVTFSLETATVQDGSSSEETADEPAALVLESPEAGTSSVTTPLPNLFMVNAVSVSISSADAPGPTGELTGGAVAVIAQFN